MNFDTDRLIQAALETGAAPLAVEEGTGLAEAWIERGILHDARIVAVECGFVFWLDERTAIVGVQDLLTEESFPVTYLPSAEREKLGRSTGTVDFVVGNEWKTTKETTKFWNEHRWLESITEGSQICVYALALRHGVYYPKVGEPITPAVAQPRIRVKAISKSTPPAIWPKRDEDGIITFTEARLETMKQALMSQADSIRARRKREGVWAVPGIHCTNQFRRVCEYHEDCVNQRPHPTVRGIQESDPAFKLAVPHLGDRVNDPELVILSASAFQKASECPEAYRRSLGGAGEESMAMGTGSVFHAVVSSYYQQIQEAQ